MSESPTPDSKELRVLRMVLGPVQTNAYLVGPPGPGEAVVIDPAWDGEVIFQEAERRAWRITQIWLTHAHFDHFGGAAAVADRTAAPVALHPDDHPLWRFSGGAPLFGFPQFDPGPEPTIPLEHGMILRLGDHDFEVRHTPGHTPGHVVLVGRKDGIVFSGDLIFQGGVGRTDLPGGDWEALLRSIREEILSLPDEMQILSGHGAETTVGAERRLNPFLT